MQKTYMAKKEDAGVTFRRDWLVVDATDQTLGRLASRLAMILQGKHKPSYTPFFDVGDYVIVINADRVRLTGKKWDQKMHYRHSGYIGHLKATPYREVQRRHPEIPIRLAVRRMLPKTELGRRMLRKLKVYPGADHPHGAQTPSTLSL
jgi:large subunit ribosomal protein L13